MADSAIATQPPDALPRGQRRPRGAYYTPDALALAICASLAEVIEPPATVLEPGCGGGAFLRAVHETWPNALLLGIDTKPACKGPGSVHHGDLFNQRAQQYSLVIGNPDFGCAEDIVRHCLSLRAPRGYLAFLLRLNMLAGLSRIGLYQEHPLWLFRPIAGRPSFTNGGTDASDYGLFVWRSGHHTGAGVIVPPLMWR